MIFFFTGVCKIYEEHLKRQNPNTPSITYDISQLFDFVDQLADLSCLVYVHFYFNQYIKLSGTQNLFSHVFELTVSLNDVKTVFVNFISMGSSPMIPFHLTKQVGTVVINLSHLGGMFLEFQRYLGRFSCHSRQLPWQ